MAFTVFIDTYFWIIIKSVVVMHVLSAFYSDNSDNSLSGTEWRVNASVNYTVYPNKYAHGFSFALLCCGYTLTDFPISIRFTSLALWQSNDYPSASKATLMNMDKYFMWIRYERLHNHNKAKHNKTVCIFLGVYCTYIGSDNGLSSVRCQAIVWTMLSQLDP